ncbi:lactam utilization protein LamB [Gracilibacillus boraciitolerans JCM 21714]|uniref:Lactam utilization protein LamB n=1 Tax=Gracilibacillus boraciitolerans JCM 21714 TaxID=1298598 RepID=W4VH11_9BACI|nr:5-oxoprolinase subunit PxpA [Gracilibacillus boraciitolerans]GAE92044.1 lactam utilization protein LamB [Gracilibacillus boraciitolerans JCM 21714]
MKKIFLNCDLGGENFGLYQIGNDEAIVPLADAVNIACGFHAGDPPQSMNKTVQLAKKHHVKIGAHPGFPDLQGFGRRKIDMLPADVYDAIIYQLGALSGFTTAHSIKLHHVKPHGALYNMACKDEKLADAIAKAVIDFDKNLILVGLANSKLVEAGKAYGLAVANEVFADRTYQSDGSLTPRSLDNAVIHDKDQVIRQVEEMINHQLVTTVTGEKIEIKADTICVHGDTVEALELVKAIRKLITH